MKARLRWLVVLALIVLGVVAYTARIQYEMVDFLTWRQSAVRALKAEPLYRPEDGHYQFKYLPAFAVVMAPLGALDEETGKVLWFAISIALLAALLRWSVGALPDRRLSQLTLVLITNTGSSPATLNWFYSDGSDVFAGGTSVATGADFPFELDGRRIEGQFVFSDETGVSTIHLHALDGGTACETLGTLEWAR